VEEVPKKEWAVSEKRRTCKQCEACSLTCRWPVKGHGRTCESCFGGHIVCIAPKRVKTSTDPVVQELRSLCRVLEAQTELLQEINLRLKRGNRYRKWMQANLEGIAAGAHAAFTEFPGLTLRMERKDEVEVLAEQVL
jgi:hypothetical protein